MSTGLPDVRMAALTGRYINLDRSEERRASIGQELKKLEPEFCYERFPASDGFAIGTRPDIADRGALGCYLSHLALIKAHIGSESWLHVVEDDILISRHARVALQALTTDPQFQRYDVVFTNVRYGEDIGLTSRLRAIFDASVTTGPSGDITAVNRITAYSLAGLTFYLTNSYMVNPRSVQKLTDLLESRLDTRPFEPVDLVFSQLNYSGELNMAVTVPFLTLQRPGVESTIQPQPMSTRPWSIGHRVREAAIYADRDVAALTEILSALDRAVPATTTAELIARAYRYLIGITYP